MSEGYAPLRRGLLEHLSTMSGADVKCFVALVMMARYKTGVVKVSFADLADTLGTNRSRVSDSMNRLRQAGYVSYEPARNQHAITTIQVNKWEKCCNQKSNTTGNSTSNTTGNSKRTASGQQADSTGTLTCGNEPLKGVKVEKELYDGFQGGEAFAETHSLFESVFARPATEKERRDLHTIASVGWESHQIEAAFRAAYENGARNVTKYALAILRNPSKPAKPKREMPEGLEEKGYWMDEYGVINPPIPDRRKDPC